MIFFRESRFTHLAEIGLFECLKGAFQYTHCTVQPRSGPLQIGSFKTIELTLICECIHYSHHSREALLVFSLKAILKLQLMQMPFHDIGIST